MMKLYKQDVRGAELVVQMDEELAKEQGLEEYHEALPEQPDGDLRAPSAKGEKEDDMGRPLIESAHVENEEAKAQRRAASNKAATASNKSE